jgi:hypothetical protein
VDEYAPKLAEDVGAVARATVGLRTEGLRFAEWLARFFEQAKV